MTLYKQVHSGHPWRKVMQSPGTLAQHDMGDIEFGVLRALFGDCFDYMILSPLSSMQNLTSTFNPHHSTQYISLLSGSTREPLTRCLYSN